MTPPDRHGARTPDAPDLELVARALAGERAAYGELVRRHQGAALRVAAGICGSTEEARDIVQDAFVTGFRALDRYRGDGPVRAWLLRIVANDARNAHRGRHRRERRERRYEAAARPAAELDRTGDTVVDATETGRVLAALGALAARDREVLALRFLAGLSEAETATVLGVAPGTVKSRTSRALARARLALEGGGG